MTTWYRKAEASGVTTTTIRSKEITCIKQLQKVAVNRSYGSNTSGWVEEKKA